MQVNESSDCAVVYDALANEYAKRVEQFRVKDLFFVGPMAAYLRAVFPNTVRRVIDVGCGAGLDCALLANEGVVTVGLDCSPNMINHACKISPSTEFLVGDFLTCDVAPESFHGVYAKAVLHLFGDENVNRFMDKCRNILVKDGLLYLSVTGGQDSELRMRPKEDYPDQPCRPKREWSRDQLLALLQSCGFEPIYWNEHFDAGRGKLWLDGWGIKAT